MQKKIFQILFRFAPNTSSYLLLNYFLKPQKHKRPKREKEMWEKGHKLILKNGIHARLYNPGSYPLVVFVHGWRGRGSQFYSFVEPLSKVGFSVMLIDGPAHGDSIGDRTNLVSFTKELVEALNFYGKDVYALIGHSFGGLSVLLSAKFGLKAKKRVTIGSPFESKKVISNFAKRFQVPDDAKKAFEEHLEKEMAMKIADVDAHPHFKTKDCDFLIIQDREDKEVPEQRAHLLHKAYSFPELFLTKGQGHFRILRAEEVVEKLIDFLSK